MKKTTFISIIIMILGTSIYAAANLQNCQFKKDKPVTAKMASMIEGQIVYEVPLKSHVKKGQLVEQVDNKQYIAQVKEDIANIEYSEQIYNDATKMVRTHSISQENYLQTKANFLDSVAEFHKDEAILNHCNIYSPFDGTVTNIITYPGSGIGDGSLIMEITKDSEA